MLKNNLKICHAVSDVAFIEIITYRTYGHKIVDV